MADMAEPAPPVSLPAKPVVVVPAEQRPEVSAPPPEAGWSMSSWKWDPYNLRATAVLPGEGEVAAGRQMGNGETAPPASTAAPVPLQPPLVPSYAMSTGSRAKGPPTCQVWSRKYHGSTMQHWRTRAGVRRAGHGLPPKRLFSSSCAPLLSSLHDPRAVRDRCSAGVPPAGDITFGPAGGVLRVRPDRPEGVSPTV